MRNSSTEFLRLNFIWVTFFFPRCVRNNNINTDNNLWLRVSQVHCMDLSQIPH